MTRNMDQPDDAGFRLSRRRFLKMTGATVAASALPAGLGLSWADQDTAPPLIVDAHLDLGWNIANYRRDYTYSAFDTRKREAGTAVGQVAAPCMLGLPEWLQGRVALLVGSIFVMPRQDVVSDLLVANYQTPQEAHRWGWQMLESIEKLIASSSQIAPVRTVAELDAVLDSWTLPASQNRVGIMLSMEGADPIETPEQLTDWYERGLRLISLTWLRRTRYAGGNADSGGLTDLGKQLLQGMKKTGIIFDTAHLAEQAFWDALRIWDGPFVYTHGMARYFLPTQRALSDEQIKALVAHQGVMGIGLYAGFYQLHRSGRAITAADIANAIDYVCQLAGNCDHVAIGTDFDGGFKGDEALVGFDTTADLQRIPSALRDKGYTPDQIDAITHGNWIRIFRQALPPG
jgi:membrane dipeptidase